METLPLQTLEMAQEQDEEEEVGALDLKRMRVGRSARSELTKKTSADKLSLGAARLLSFLLLPP